MKEVLQYRTVGLDTWGADYGEWVDLEVEEGIEIATAWAMEFRVEFRRVNRGTCGTCGTGNVEFPIPN